MQLTKLTCRFGPPDPYNKRIMPKPYPVYVMMAEKRELLEFANAIRNAGGADPVEALMPSNPSSASKCLIANALNFEGRVDSMGELDSGGWYTRPLLQRSLDWRMFLPENMLQEKADELARATGCQLGTPTARYRGFSLVLPHYIGNAAHAFDSGDAYQEYRNEEYRKETR